MKASRFLHEDRIRSANPSASKNNATQRQSLHSDTATRSLAALQLKADNSTHVRALSRLQRVAHKGLSGNTTQALPQTAQRRALDEEPLQAKAIQREPHSAISANNTGLPDNLKSGIEQLSGMSMDHVRVHRNSDKPAAVQAHAYAQGSDIHLGPGQDNHLPHEAWHVVQQAQGRVNPTMQVNGVAINDDSSLESEADAMGAKATQMKPK